MAARGEELTRKIEESIRQAVEQMVSDIRSSIDDVKEAVNQQLNAASQSVQADAKSLSLRAQLGSLLDEIDRELEAPAPPPPPPAGEGAAKIRTAIRAIERGKSQVEILNALLEQARTFCSRSALLILRGDSFVGWKGAGFAAHGGNDEAIKQLSLGANDLPSLRRLVEQETVVPTDGSEIAGRVGASQPARALLVPMVLKDKIAAAFYADAMEGDDRKFDRGSLELLVFTTGLLIDTLPIRKKIPSPTLSAEQGDATMVIAPEATRIAPPPPGRPEPAPAAAARPTVVPQVPSPPPPAPAPPSAPPRTSSFELEQPPARPAAAPPPPPRPQPAAAPPPPPPPARPAAPPPPAAAPAAGEGERPSTQYIPPPGVTGGRFGAQQPQSADAKKHDEAKRFARLLVSEIKLYNEAKVDEGRKNRDLYERMKEDIDRSRQMYEERIPDEVRRGSNYFYDELVRILADGNPDLLGL